MSSATRLEPEKLRTRKIIATAALTVVAIALLVLSDASDAASAAPPDHQVANEQVPSVAAQAEQTPAGQTAFTAGPVRPQEE